jgi:hypothetical protein
MEKSSVPVSIIKHRNVFVRSIAEGMYLLGVYARRW